MCFLHSFYFSFLIVYLPHGYHVLPWGIKKDRFVVYHISWYLTKQPSKLCECFFIKNGRPGAKSAQSLPFYLTIFICRGFKSLWSVKIMKKHPWFYTKIFRLKNMKKARKIGAAIRNVNNRLRKKKLSAIGLVMLIE